MPRPRIQRVVLEVPRRGFRSREAASFVAQLDALTGYLRKDLRGLKRRELEFQPAPGMNSIGMLLAHIAIVEVWWIDGVVRRIPPDEVDFPGKLGIGKDDDGMPSPPRGRHPEPLRGRTLAGYVRTLRRARANLVAAAKRLTDADLSRVRRRIRLDGRVQIYNGRWVLFHLLEHLAGHYGQILMLRHAYRVRRRTR